MTRADPGRSWAETYDRAEVLVLGGTGFIGRWTAHQLARLNARVHVGVRDRGQWERVSASYGMDLTVHEIDALDASGLAALLNDLQPAVTFNLIGYGVDRSETDPEVARQVNTELPERLVSMITPSPPGWPGPRLVHVGSAAEYGAVGGDLSEVTSARPVGTYGRSKWAGTAALERAARIREIRAVTARTFTVYGPGEHDGRLLPSLMNAATTPGVLPLTAGRQRRDFTYVEDVAEGLLRLGAAESIAYGEIINLCTGVLTSVRGFVEEAARILPIPSDRLGFGLMPEREDEMAHDPVSVERCRRRLDWVPPTLIGEGIRRSVEFGTG